MGLLDGDLRDSIFAGFQGKLKTGTLYERTIPESGGLDELGDPLDVASSPTHAIEGFTDNYSAFTRAQAGFPETDLKLCFFGATIPGIEPQRGWVAKLGTEWFQIRNAEVDPAGALWTCQSFKISAPEGLS